MNTDEILDSLKDLKAAAPNNEDMNKLSELILRCEKELKGIAFESHSGLTSLHVNCTINAPTGCNEGFSIEHIPTC